MENKLVQILIIALVALMIASLVAMVYKRTNAVYFWVLMAVGALIAYFLRRKRKAGRAKAL